MADAKAEYPKLDAIFGKKHTLTFDTNFKFQDEELETRYKKFKDFRDKELQKPVPEDKKWTTDETKIN